MRLAEAGTRLVLVRPGNQVVDGTLFSCLRRFLSCLSELTHRDGNATRAAYE